MSKSTARLTGDHDSSPLLEEPPAMAASNSKSVHIVPVVNNTSQGTKSSFEPKDEFATGIGAATPEPRNVKGSSKLEGILHVHSSGPQFFNAIQLSSLTENIPGPPVSAVPPSSWVASIRAAAELRMEQEEDEFRAVKESVMAEISRLQNLIAEQKTILTTAREKKDKNIEKARRIIEAENGTLLQAKTKAPLAYSISSIPPELLLPILALVDMEWTPLRLVCKQWNSIILNNGQFWNDIVLTSRPDSANPVVYGHKPWQPRQQLCRSLSAVKEALKRSKLAPLSITIDFIDFAGKPPDIDEFGETSFNAGSQRMQKRREAVKLVGEEMPRIRTLSIFAIGRIPSGTVEGSFEPERAVILEKLYVKGRMYDSSAEDMQFSQLISAANLQTLRFLDRPPDRPAPVMNWSGLIDVSVERLFVDWKALVTPLTLPTVRILRLGGWSLDTLRNLRTPCLDSLVIHDLTYPLQPDMSHFGSVDVPSVTSLHLSRNFAVLDMLNIPTVTHIELQSDHQNKQEIDNKWISTIFKGAESRFPNLTSLVLCTYTSSGSIGKGLAHLPHLVDLCVDAKHRKLATVFWNDFARTVKGRDRSKTLKIVPNLKRLFVRLYHERASAIEELATKAKVARELAGQPLSLLVVKWKDGGASTFAGEELEKGAAVFPRQSLSFPE